MYELVLYPPARKFLKKTKEKGLQNAFEKAFESLCENPYIGRQKVSDFSGVYGLDVYYNKTNYEISYRIEEIDGKLVIVILVGTRENFYKELKKYLNGV
jgi:mRNA interferase RelE/StbE